MSVTSPILWLGLANHDSISLGAVGLISVSYILEPTGVPASFHHRTAPLPPNVQCATADSTPLLHL